MKSQAVREKFPRDFGNNKQLKGLTAKEIITAKDHVRNVLPYREEKDRATVP